MDSVSADQKGPDLVDAKYVDINGFQFMREMEFVNFYSDDEDNGGEISFELNLENVRQAPFWWMESISWSLKVKRTFAPMMRKADSVVSSTRRSTR